MMEKQHEPQADDRRVRPRTPEEWALWDRAAAECAAGLMVRGLGGPASAADLSAKLADALLIERRKRLL